MPDQPDMPGNLLHRLTHRIPGVPAHRERAPRTPHGLRHHSPHRRGGPFNHDEDHPPRVLVAWQRRIAALFGRDLP